MENWLVQNPACEGFIWAANTTHMVVKPEGTFLEVAFRDELVYIHITYNMWDVNNKIKLIKINT